MKIMSKTPLAKALDAMSCIPFAQEGVEVSKDKCALTIAGVEAGTICNPNVALILEKSVPSSFGKGSETVLDPSYRSGREIHGENIGLTDDIAGQVLYNVKRIMFPGHDVEVKLYKLAIYEVGGHFDWHMDSTHSDKHHATLLVGLNTSWEGGDLVLRRNGIETHVDLRARKPASDEVDEDDDWMYVQTVVFFTDTEHRVEPVESGIRIVLQYDVELEKTPKGENEVKSEGNHEETDENEGNHEGEDESDEEIDEEESDEERMMLGDFMNRYSLRAELRGDAQATSDNALKEVIAIIKKMHKNGAREVAFALQHLYRKASISGEYLKGSDASLYDALKGEFDVSLHPVILQEGQTYENIIERGAYRYCEPCDAVEGEESNNPPPLFHIPELSGIQEISKQDFVEYVGNEALDGDYRYFGGGMFIRPKSKST